MRGAELQAFLTHLAIDDNVAASTQSQVLNAVVFLHRQVLNQDLAMEINAVRVKRSRYFPAVLTKDVKTTMIYTHVFNRGGRGVRSPVNS